MTRTASNNIGVDRDDEIAEEPKGEVPTIEDQDQADLPADGTPLKPARSYEGETPEGKTEREKAVRESYAAAEKRLREKYLDEFNAFHKEEAAKRGFDWSPRPTAAEKAEAALKALLESNPELAEKIKSGDL